MCIRDRDLGDPAHLRLTNMVQQNALRLEQIVRDVLHLAQASAPDIIDAQQSLNLPEATQRICRDWKNQHAVSDELLVVLCNGSIAVNFDPEHLRRILINLLDNALRDVYKRQGKEGSYCSVDHLQQSEL